MLSLKQVVSQPGVRAKTMPPPTSSSLEVPNAPVVTVTGGTGYVGGRLIPLLEQQSVVLRCLARNPDKLRPLVKESTQIVRGDVLDPSSLGSGVFSAKQARGWKHG